MSATLEREDAMGGNALRDFSIACLKDVLDIVQNNSPTFCLCKIQS